jgi:hypothetical protein
MNIRKILIPALITLISLQSSSQKILSLTDEYPWSIHNLKITGIKFADFSEGNSLYAISMNEKEKIVPIKIDKNEFGVCKVNSSGKQVWQANLPGEIRGLGKLGTNIIAFSVDDILRSHTIDAYILDQKNGKILQKKIAYKNTTDFLLETKVQNKPDGSFNDLLVRTSNFIPKTTLRFSSPRAHELAINKLEALFFMPDLTIKSINLKPSVSVDMFCGSVVCKNGDIAVAAAGNDNLYVFRFNGDGKELGKIFTPMPNVEIGFSCLLSPDETDDNKIIVATRQSPTKKTLALKVLTYDFGAGRVVTSDDVEINKAFAKSFKLNEVKGSETDGIKYIESLRLAGIIQWENKIAILQQIENSFMRTDISNPRNNDILPTYYTGAWVLSIYDKNLNPLHTLGLDRKFESGIPLGLSIGYHLRNEHLYIVCPTETGNNRYGTLFSDVNLAEEKIGVNDKLEKDDLKKLNFIEGGSTLWFDKTMLLHYIIADNKFLASPEIHSMFQEVEY